MKIPRNISGISLAKKLSRYGYLITRQTGSHIRLTTEIAGEHHLTIPKHDPLKIGTLSAILSSVASHLGNSKEDIIKEIF